MAFIALGAPDPTTHAAASRSDPGMNVDSTPFGIAVAPSAQEVASLLSDLGAGGFLSVSLKDRSDLVYVNPSAILYVTD
jgi:hypothetical protein